jgi:preprotein translocase SecE subunit
VARDRKRAKQRQRRAAARSQQRPQRREPEAAPTPEEEENQGLPERSAIPGVTGVTPEVTPDNREIADLHHASADADLARATIAAGSVDAEATEDVLEEEAGKPEEHEETEAEFERRQAREGAAGGPVAFLRNSWAELRRVQWPDRRQTAQGTAVTLVFVVIAGAYLGFLDYVWQQLIDFIL